MIAADVQQLIVACEDWYRVPVELDGTATEAAQDWSEILADHARALSSNPADKALPVDLPRLQRALSRGVPSNMRADVWLAFSGAAERLRRRPHLYEELCERVAAHHARRGDGGGADGAAGDGSAEAAERHAALVLEQVEKDLNRTDIGTEAGRLRAMRRGAPPCT